jgi:hypothetical protein
LISQIEGSEVGFQEYLSLFVYFVPNERITQFHRNNTILKETSLATHIGLINIKCDSITYKYN